LPKIPDPLWNAYSRDRHFSSERNPDALNGGAIRTASIRAIAQNFWEQGTASTFSRWLPNMQERSMSFSTTSYFAGVGTVLAALTVGFSGALFLAPSNEHSEQNRLQRISSSAPVSVTVPQTGIVTGPEAAHPRAVEITAAAPTPSAPQPTRTEAIPIMAKAGEQAAPEIIKTAEPVRPASQDVTAKSEINSERKRAAEVKAERKRAQRSAERRKQREIELATAAVKRMPWDPGPQQFADRTESPRFGFFGED
jgi:type IV secretory pathway VirB10-like protein